MIAISFNKDLFHNIVNIHDSNIDRCNSHWCRFKSWLRAILFLWLSVMDCVFDYLFRLNWIECDDIDKQILIQKEFMTQIGFEPISMWIISNQHWYDKYLQYMMKQMSKYWSIIKFKISSNFNNLEIDIKGTAETVDTRSIIELLSHF